MIDTADSIQGKCLSFVYFADGIRSLLLTWMTSTPKLERVLYNVLEAAAFVLNELLIAGKTEAVTITHHH